MIKDWREVTDIDFPEVKVTEKARQRILDSPLQHAYCGARIAMGKIVTIEDYEERRKIAYRALP